MPLVISIDCALRRLNLALSDSRHICGELSIDAGARQSELLPSAVGYLLRTLGRELGELGLVSVTIGPGYFTGIRVGVSYAAALAESLGIKVAPVPTLLAMAHGAIEILGPGIWTAPLIPAGRNAIYAAVYAGNTNGGMSEVIAPSYIGSNDFFARITDAEPAVPPVLVGIAPSEAAPDLKYRFLPVRSMSSSVALLALETEPLDPALIRPDYLREPLI
jgi:tRNA threonylcarbamoyladenosine biosynthesis protein TsaB